MIFTSGPVGLGFLWHSKENMEELEWRQIEMRHSFTRNELNSRFHTHENKARGKLLLWPQNQLIVMM